MARRAMGAWAAAARPSRPLALRSKRKANGPERTCGWLDSLKALLKPTPFRPICPAAPRLDEAPASHSARTSRALMPASLCVVQAAPRVQWTAHVGAVPGG